MANRLEVAWVEDIPKSKVTSQEILDEISTRGKVRAACGGLWEASAVRKGEMRRRRWRYEARGMMENEYMRFRDAKKGRKYEVKASMEYEGYEGWW